MKRPALKPDMNLGAEPKKVALLGGLIVVAAIVYYINHSDTPSNPAPARPASSAPAPALNAVRRPEQISRQSIARTRVGQMNRGASVREFKPTLKPKDPIDPSKVDPILHLALLDRLRKVEVEGATRSLFDFASAPPPTAAPAQVAKVNPILPPRPFIGPIDQKAAQERAAKAAAAAPKPPPPPIPLKFYGFTSLARQGHKRAFFLEGEDIFVAGEGELIKNRYKVVRIGINSAVVEDTSNQHQQTLPLVAEGVAS